SASSRDFRGCQCRSRDRPRPNNRLTAGPSISADEGLRNRPGGKAFKVPSNRGSSYHCVFVSVDDSALREIFSVLPALVRTSLSSLASHPIAISRTWSESFVSFFSR